MMDNRFYLGPRRRAAPLVKEYDLQIRNPNRLVLWFLLSIPIVWALGIPPLAALGFALLFLRYRSHPRAPEIALLSVGAALSFSLLMAALNGEPADRVLAAAYNLFVLLCAVVALNFGRQVDLTFARTASLRRPLIVFFFVYALSIGAALIVGAPFARTGIEFPSLLTGQIAQDMPGLLGYYASARITGADWSSGASLPRPLAFGVYFNEGALMFLMSGIIALLASRAKPTTLTIAICLIAGLFILRSRMMVVATILALSVGVIARLPLARRAGVLVASILLISGITFFVLRPDLVASFVDQILSSRESSSETRLLSYIVAMDMTWRENPIFGLGIKPRDEFLFSNVSTPIGSHSTIISVFTKGGILALIPLLIFCGYSMLASFRLLFLYNSVGVYRNAQATLGATVLVILAWMLVEDFDAPIYGTMLAFLVLGSAFGLLERLDKCEQKAKAPFAYPVVESCDFSSLHRTN